LLHTTSLQASGLQDVIIVEAKVPTVKNPASKIDFKFFMFITFFCLRKYAVIILIIERYGYD
jgi:hypothetical protein